MVKLERDYRSTPQVVGLANRLIGQAPKRKGLPGLRLLGQRPDAAEPTFLEHPDEPAEAAAVAGKCKAFIDAGMPAAEIAVLFRINAQSQVYEAALADVGVPYVLKGGERFFERPEVREAVLLLRGAAAGGSDPGALVPTVRDVLASVGWAEHRPPAGGAARDRWQSSPPWSTWRSTWWRRTRPSTSPASWGTWPSGPMPSTPRPCRASPSRRCTRRKAWSGTSSSSSVSSTEWSRSRSR
ncbi:3'-5' exonuclease [Blastococcus brunescens]|uniref:3'-5' exonuclease n=1 Tax=Blastococcus brunescens TaxID=1564165 RepID=A0ABZ1B8I3_9ACTN|nr:3'-5' exonuclease [Blastococcus sp. BMG 8361]WRL67123.1 3'-5' exonuclease [Blastococcus sp. BMG 8361]